MIFCNCYAWVLYAYVVDNILPLFVNCVSGMLTSVVFGGIYYRWSEDRPHVHKLCAVAFLVLALYTVYYIIGTSGVTNQSDDSVEKTLGIFGDVVSLVLYASPLETMKKVIQTKDATTVPIIISAIFLTNTAVWTIFSIADDDMFVLVPNAIGAVVCFAQVVPYVMYPPRASKEASVNDFSEGDLATIPCEDVKDIRSSTSVT
ncbi:unnamed protein product [Phytophthora lilii]|uniref:Sugar transporter SWEET1 n=1 Tax=Phytophthora lilii TaxID=2077276 RepID=A0A9W6U5R3_9STRA|nr:unnamed protein product [Phytophthora lilii]